MDCGFTSALVSMQEYTLQQYLAVGMTSIGEKLKTRAAKIQFMENIEKTYALVLM